MSRRFQYFLLPILLLLYSYIALLARETLRFRHITIDEGLSQGAVYALAQDRQGFVWIGTKDGLNKYDGYGFTIYQHNPFDSATISNNFITAIFEDSRGVLWIGTAEGGLNRLNKVNGKFKHFRHRSDDTASLSNNHIKCIAGAANGDLWIGTENGLNLLRRDQLKNDKLKFKRFYSDSLNQSSLSNNQIISLLADRKGNLWVGTGDGLNRISGSSPDKQKLDIRRYQF